MSTWPEPQDTPLSFRRAAALEDACASIAPSWPLDRLIAVNPLWEMRQQPFAQVAARLAALGHVECFMPADYYRALWQNPVHTRHLHRAIHELGLPLTEADMRGPSGVAPQQHWYNVSDLVDSERDRDPTCVHRMSWHEEIIHQISQFCGDLMSTRAADTLNADSVYQAWLDGTRADRGLAILMNEPGLSSAFDQLPNRVDELFAEALDTLAVDDSSTSDYALALLLDINGWASSLAWLRWQARLEGADNDALRGLLAIRMAWDWVLWRLYQPRTAENWPALWKRQWQSLPSLVANHAHQQQLLLAWQRAAELAWQEDLISQLSAPVPSANPAPLMQAAFCIDVRSERMRRALEAQHPAVETLGFAGFFGLPLAFQPAGSRYQRPQLPGLLPPSLVATTSGEPRVPTLHNRWQRFAGEAPSTFTAVESGGLFYLFKLLRQSFLPPRNSHPVNRVAARADGFRLLREGREVSTSEKADLALGILTAMGLRGRLAPRVLLVGHGSSTCNNPHAAGLDCGACGGQTGEVNVRVLAQLLNDPAVRQQLATRGEAIPEDTRFVAALHNTTTDAITCFPERDEDVDDTAQGWLLRASEATRRERADSLGLSRSTRLAQDLEKRSRDWSQVRPEWGLAGNAGFVVAPRQRTRHLNLHGRCFLHDYQWQRDEGFTLLETIMTAPMVVTHWINMQYNSSTTDNHKLGSGNKALHNVVGGNLGVFEGNGGDLRIGLPLQSVHDGERWMHEPLRLSVVIAAPEDAILSIYRKHAVVSDLVDNEWLFLFRLGDRPGEVSRLHAGAFAPEPRRPDERVSELA